MSRIGKNPIIIPENVDIVIKNNSINVKGPRGSLSFDFHNYIEVIESGGQLLIERKQMIVSKRHCMEQLDK